MVKKQLERKNYLKLLNTGVVLTGGGSLTQLAEEIFNLPVRIGYPSGCGGLVEEVNSKTENIGARRLHTVMEYLLEDVSFEASELKGQTINITPAYIDEKLGNVIEDQDLSRYIL